MTGSGKNSAEKRALKHLEKRNNSWFYKNVGARWQIMRLKFTMRYAEFQTKWMPFFPIGAILLVLVILPLFVYFFPRMSYPSWHLSNTGQIGDTVGGLTAPIIGLLNAILLWWTLKVQNDHIHKQDTIRDFEKRLELIDEHIGQCKLTVNVPGPFNHPKRKKYKGIEALIRASEFVRDPTSLERLQLDTIEWKVFLRSVEGVYRNMDVATNMLVFEKTLASDKDEKKELIISDLVNQTSEVLDFAQAYISFMDTHRNSSSYQDIRDEIGYHNLRNKYSWSESYIAMMNGDIQMEPDDPDGDGPAD
jgi:hypothetical protein